MTLSGAGINERRDEPEPEPAPGSPGSSPDDSIPPPNEDERPPPHGDDPHYGWGLGDPRGGGEGSGDPEDPRQEPPPEPPPGYYPPGPRDEPSEPDPFPFVPPPEPREPPPPPTEEEARRVIDDARAEALRAMDQAEAALRRPNRETRFLFSSWFGTDAAAVLEEVRERIVRAREALFSAEIRYVSPSTPMMFAGDPALFDAYHALSVGPQSAVTIAGTAFPRVTPDRWHIAVGPTFVTRPDLAPTRLVHEAVHLSDPEGTRHAGGPLPPTETRRTSSWCIQGFVSMVAVPPLDLEASRVRSFCGRL